MKFKIMSDIHTEISTFIPSYGENEDKQALEEKETVLLLAGDIGSWGKKGRTISTFIRQMCRRFHTVVMIPGNHEYYGTSIQRTENKLRGLMGTEKFENYIFLQNESVEIDGTKIIGSTLWTDFDKGSPLIKIEAQDRMNDYRYIKFGDNFRKFNTSDAICLHLESVKYLKEELAKNHSKTIVMTHHAPCSMSINPKYQGQDLNFCYFTDLSEIILDYMPNFWIHGHMHDSVDYTLGKTRVLCNPRGYAPLDVNPNFEQDLIIEL